jgi:predicted Zn-dependent protease
MRPRLSAFLPFLLLTAGCAVNPATGGRQLSLVSEAQEIQIGRDADRQIVASMGLYPDEAVQQYVSALGRSLAARSERPDLPWTFRVIDDPTVNAFALPGGFIYVTRGILTHLGSEAELAGVLGHEIGHVTARHSVSQMSRAQLAQLGLGIGMIFSEEIRQVGEVAGAGLQLLFLKFGRDDEREADELGVRYMTRLDYDPRELAHVMGMLARSSELQSGSGKVPEWLSTHPDPENRGEAIMAMAEESGIDLSRAVVGRPTYLRRLDGMIFGVNPREGYTEDGVFHHPDLAFRMAVPGAWQVYNGKTEVQFVSPREDGAVLLTLAEGGAREALTAFGSQQGIRMGATRARSVNGIDGFSAPFEAQTQQGTIAGEVLFLRYDGNTYRLIGLSSTSGWPGLATAARGIMESFRRETDSGVLAMQPDRLRLVELDRAVSLTRFLERYPSPVRPEVMALINQVGPDGTVPAGLAKRVLGSR